MTAKEMTWLVELAEDFVLENTDRSKCVLIEDPHILDVGQGSQFEVRSGKSPEIEKHLNDEAKGKDVMALSMASTPWFDLHVEKARETLQKAAGGLATALENVRRAYEGKSARRLTLVRSRVLMENAKGREFPPGSVKLSDNAVRLIIRYTLRKA